MFGFKSKHGGRSGAGLPARSVQAPAREAQPRQFVADLRSREPVARRSHRRHGARRAGDAADHRRRRRRNHGAHSRRPAAQGRTQGARRSQCAARGAAQLVAGDPAADAAAARNRAHAAPFAILVVGVNGAGKTTTIGKLARQLKQQGLKVMLAAGDTFRAAAVEQLQIWGDRNDVTVIAQGRRRRSRRCRLRRAASGARTAYRRVAGGYCRASAHAVEPDGRAEKGEACDGPGR